MWKKSFKMRKLQTVMIFFVVMICSTLLTCAASILLDLEKPLYDFSKEVDAPAALLYPYVNHQEFVQYENEVRKIGENFSRLSEVEGVGYAKFHYIYEEITSKGKKVSASLDLTEYNNSYFSKERFLSGDIKMTQRLQKGECIIPACLSNTFNINVNDVINIHFSKGTKSYRVKEIYTNPYSSSTAFASDIFVKELPGFLASSYKLSIYGKGGASGNDIETAYRNKYNGQMAGTMIKLNDVINNSLVTVKIISAIFLAIGITMLFVSTLIISFMIRNVMITDAKDIAIYKTIGYTNTDILKMYLIFNYIIVTAACLLGLLVSWFLSGKILAIAYENIGHKTGGDVLLPGIICYILIVGFVQCVIAIIIGSTRRVKPVIALNGMQSEGIKKRENYKGNSKIQFSPMGIALRTITRGKKGIASILITCIVTIFAINFAVVSLDVANTMKENNDYWIGIDRSDVAIGISDDENFKNINDILKQDKRIKYIVPNSYDNLISLKWQKGMDITGMRAFVYDDYTHADIPLTSGRNPSAGNEIALSYKVSEKLHKNIGDYVEVYINGATKADLLVTGIFQTYYTIGQACRLTSAAFTDNKETLSYNNISIYLKKGYSTSDFIKSIKRKIGIQGVVIPRTERFSSVMNSIVAPQQRAIPLIITLILLLGGVNIFCIVMLRNATQQKTVGIYKSIGYSTWHLVKSNLYYIGILSIVSLTITIPLLILTYPQIMEMCLSAFGFIKYPVKYNWFHLIITNIGVFITFIISTLISSWTLQKVNAKELVHE